jgi:integrase
MKLTPKTISAITLPQGKSEHVEWDDDLPAFGLRLRQGGARTWIYQYKVGKQNRKHTLGNATVLSPAHARTMATELHAKVRLGQDPSAEKIEGRVRAGETMGAILENYLVFKRAQLKPRSMVELERHLRKNCKPLHALQLVKIDRRAVAARISAVATDKGGPTANRVRAALSAFFVWCIGEGLLDANAVIGTNIHEENPRERVLSDHELKRIWDALGSDDYAQIIKMLMLTGARANEVGGLRWSEIVGDEIRLPSARTKNNRSHTIPITAAVREILDGCRRSDDVVFGRSQGFRGWAWAKERLDKRIKAAGGELEHWTTHDIRRTVATMMADKLAVAPHIIERVLGHASGLGRIHTTYNRADYEVPKRIALEKWSDYVLAMLSGKQPAKVVQLRGA